MSTVTITFYPSDQGTRTFHFEKNNVDEAVTANHRGFEAQKELTQGSLCYFDGITNFEGRHGTKPLVVDSSRQQDLRRLVVVVRGRTKTDYRTSFDAVCGAPCN